MTMRAPLDRRLMLRGSASLAGLGALGLVGCAAQDKTAAPGLPIYDRVPPLAPIRADINRLFDITVCLRPFRAAGPRLDTEQIGHTLVVHNYGHGGSGWSLSWGSSTIAVQKAMSVSPRKIAVIGCGALGLTSALLAQSAGARRHDLCEGFVARCALVSRDGHMDARFPHRTRRASPARNSAHLWEQMARTSFKTYRRYLGLPGNPVEWTDRYFLSDIPPEEAREAARARSAGLCKL